jgi:ABC-type polysaccharide/polyol phosphate export permease
LMEVVRAPLLGQIPSLSSWLVSSVLACMGLLFARYVLFRWGSRLAYWV